jgi:hypothetical protein
MALVAVVERAGDRPGTLPETQIVPVGMPQDTGFSAYFGDVGFSLRLGEAPTLTMSPMMAPVPEESSGPDFFRVDAMAPPAESGPEDELLDLASQMEPDGGMPGTNEEERVLSTVLALLCFLSEGHSEKAGAFRSHVKKLVSYLRSVEDQYPTLRIVLTLAARGESLPGDWFERSPTRELWKEIEQALDTAKTLRG